MKDCTPSDFPEEIKLERFIHQELRRLPDQTAPEDLADRVLAQLKRSESLPWWRRSIWHWPPVVRRVLLPALALLSLAITAIASGFFPGWESLGFPGVVWLQPVTDMGHQIVTWWNNSGKLAYTVAQPWLWGSGLILAASLFFLFGAGTLVFRLSLLPRPSLKCASL